jgi:hypothetical protein
MENTDMKTSATSLTYTRPDHTRDLRDGTRLVLAHGEATGHCHEVIDARVDDGEMPAAEYFEEPDGRRILLVTRPCLLRHPEHGAIALDPACPIQARQGDVLLQPIGAGAWEVKRQREYSPAAIRQVAD